MRLNSVTKLLMTNLNHATRTATKLRRPAQTTRLGSATSLASRRRLLSRATRTTTSRDQLSDVTQICYDIGSRPTIGCCILAMFSLSTLTKWFGAS